MNAILLCPSPSSQPAVEHLSTLSPLAAIPLLGESLVEYWLTHLAMTGATEVRILAHDRPEHIAAIVGTGARWGLKAQVIAEKRDIALAQARIIYEQEIISGSHEVFVLDHFPGSPNSLFTGYADLFAEILEWIPKAKTPDRVGVRELRPGIWVGLQTWISPKAQLHPPCWIGQNVYIGAGAVVGPMAIIEDRSFVEPKAEIICSMIGPDTFVGKLAVIQQAFAWGSHLIDWKSNLFTRVTDAFTLCELRRPAAAHSSERLLERLTLLYSRNRDELQTLWKHFLLDKDDELSTHDKL
jgi:carbonic anhydrase/acetyltransferase-like protein (isoleucine patch superfamily)